MKKIPNCLKCGSEYVYEDRNLFVCPECNYEWLEALETADESSEQVVKDAYGNILKSGDTVTIIKDLKVKVSSTALKIGVKVKNIRIVDEVNGHNIEGKVPDFGTMMLKSEIVKKSQD
jgi:protein PhnA